MPWFISEANHLECIFWIALGEAILLGVLFQPLAFAGLVEISMKFNFFIAGHGSEFGGSEVHRGPELVFAVSRWKTNYCSSLRKLILPFLPGDPLGDVAPVSGNYLRRQSLVKHIVHHLDQRFSSLSTKLRVVAQGD